ncbi:MAG: FtsK/SpoIIIE domain-containing protein, partial [Acidimicrobiia bacterium]|nr:FtsK/SpoIIIE domain-containing protein [Acidimicrobiia bacterium]
MSDQVIDALLTVDEAGRRRDIAFSAPASATLREVLDGAGLAEGPWYVDGRTLDPDATLAEGSLRAGVIVSNQPGEARHVGEGGTLELRGVTPEVADASWIIGEGSHQIGRALASIIIDHQSVSRLHAEFLVSGGKVTIRDLDSTNGTFLNDTPVEGRAAVVSGDRVRLGDVEFVLDYPEATDASLQVTDDGTVAFNRPGRFTRPRPTLTLRPPQEVRAQDKPAFPWATLISPVAVALIALFVFQRPEMLLLSAVGPIAAVAQYVSRRRQAAKKAEQDAAEFQSGSAEFEQQLSQALQAERTWLEGVHPDPAETHRIATLPTQRLWERRPTDSDFLHARVGTAALPSEVKVESGDEIAPTLERAPLAVSLRAGVVGVAGSRTEVLNSVRSMLVNVASLHAPNDLQVVVIANDTAGSEWSWCRWLPHVTEGAQSRVGLVDETHQARLAEVDELIKIRQELEEGSGGAAFTPEVLVVVDGAQRYRNLESFINVLRSGPAVGVHTLAIESDAAKLPGESTTQLIVGDGQARLDRAGENPVEGVVLDSVTADQAERAARSLLPITLVGGAEAQLPRSVRLIDVLSNVDAATIHSGWSAGAPTTKATIGVTSSGPFSVDLRRDGPHTLIAGTTGSGKTELLQSLLGSLAVANPPEGLGFLLVDYKGGGDYADLIRLPHTLGMVSNLNESLTQRAIVALKAEVERRQTELADLRESGRISEANVEAAWRDAPDEARARQLGRLVIVVDEFALFARNLPNFVEGLVQLTEQGRSLGMHLIISVQRPAGVVTGSIKANTGLRIVLRTERGESVEVLETAHADSIARSTPGRGFVRLGDPPRLVEFQSARVGGARPDVASQAAVAVWDAPWNRTGYAVARQEAKPAAGSTDLAMLVEHVTTAGEGLAVPDSPWPAHLPEELAPSDLPAAGDGEVVWGVVDRPGEREIAARQAPLTLRFGDAANLAIVGAPGSGRSTALLSLASRLAQTADPDAAQLVAFDFGTGALAPLGDLPHTGGVVVNDQDRFERYVERLIQEVDTRRRTNRTTPELFVL